MLAKMRGMNYARDHFFKKSKLMKKLLAIEVAHQRGWKNLWLECDSNLVVQAFSSLIIVSWRLQTRWRNCFSLTSGMQFRVTHIYREGNSCADKLANWWDLIPQFIWEDFFRNRFDLPSYRFK